jgi:hypothetical protein
METDREEDRDRDRPSQIRLRETTGEGEEGVKYPT